MLNSVKINRRQSEIRQQLATLAGKEKPTEDEVRSLEGLDLEYRTNETRYRAALIGEETERREAGAERYARQQHGIRRESGDGDFGSQHHLRVSLRIAAGFVE